VPGAAALEIQCGFLHGTVAVEPDDGEPGTDPTDFDVVGAGRDVDCSKFGAGSHTRDGRGATPIGREEVD